MVSTHPLPRAQKTPAAYKAGTVILFEGPDKSGKTTLAQECASRLALPYFKNPRERQQKLNGEIGLVTKYCGLWLADFMRQVPISAVIDRHYPSEWVYSLVEERPRDEELLREIDQAFADVHAKIIICTRKNYEGFVDETTPSRLLPFLAETYREFALWSSVKDVLLLDTSSEDLEAQWELISEFLL